MSVKKKRSSSSLSSSNKFRLTHANDSGSLSTLISPDINNDKSIEKIEKQFKRMSTIFHKSKHDDNRSMYSPKLKKNSSSASKLDMSNIDSPTLPTTNNFYNLRNNSSGTIISTKTYNPELHLNQINNVEFTNVRNSIADDNDLNSSSSSVSLNDRKKESKFGRFLSKTGHKVKKFSDFNTDPLNLGLGLNGSLHLNTHHNHHTLDQTDNNSNNPNSNHNMSSNMNHNHGNGNSGNSSHNNSGNNNSNNGNLSILNINTNLNLNGGNSNHLFPEPFLGNNGKDLKSPISRTFGNTSQKLSFSEKLKLLNSTRYKNYHYHNLLRNKKESIKNGMKLGSKNNDLLTNVNINNTIAGTSYALFDVNYIEIERMLDNEILNFEQCETYCKFLFPRIKNLLIPLFKNEMLQSSIEDITKLVGLYVRIRKNQEMIKEREINNNNNNSNINNNNTNTNNTIDSFTNEGFLDDYKTPFMKPSAVFGSEINSPSSFSPLVKIRTTSYSAISKVLEEINELLKFGMIIMINQLYYDDITNKIKFVRGSNPILKKRHNTITSQNNNVNSSNNNNTFNSINRTNSNEFYRDSVDPGITNNNSNILNVNSIGTDMRLNTSTKSITDLPILTPIQTYTSTLNDFNDNYRSNNNSNNNNNNNNNIRNDIDIYNNPYLTDSTNDIQNELQNLGILPAGKFEQCVSILWDIFQRNVLYEMNSILLPIELEFASGHKEISAIHNLSNAILYNNGEKIKTFTNTTIYPDISGPKTNNNNINNFEAKDVGIVGSLGEWSDINIRNVLLVGFRDNIIIPLYEANRRRFEDDNERIRPDKSNKKSNNKLNATVIIQEYIDAFELLQCFRVVSGVGTGDTNQKLVENLLIQMKDRVRQFET